MSSLETISEVLDFIKAHDHEGASWSVTLVTEADITDRVRNIYEKVEEE